MGRSLTGFTDATARRPHGPWARRHYRAPRSHMRLFALALAELQPQADDIYLEIGCGGGYFLDLVLARAARAAALDHSPEMVALARQTNRRALEQGRVEIVEGRAESLPWPDESFTCTANTGMWFFVEQPRAALAELHRVLRPGGRIVIATARKSWLNRLLWAVFSLRLYSDRELVDLLRQSGFAEIRFSSPGLLNQIAVASKPANPA